MSFKVTWLGHASFACEIEGYQVLIDPYCSGNPATTVDPGSLPADYILVSHGHGDHLGDTVSIAKRTGAKVISNAEICGWLGKQGVKNTHAQHIGGGYHHEFGYVKLTIAHHGSGLPDGHYGGNPCGFLITSKSGQRAYFACDTGLFYEMKFYGDEGIDLAFVPIGDNFTMGPADALKAVELLNPKVVVPIHYNTWGVIAQDPHAWAREVESKTQTRVLVLQPGESTEVG